MGYSARHRRRRREQRRQDPFDFMPPNPPMDLEIYETAGDWFDELESPSPRRKRRTAGRPYDDEG